MRKIYFALLCVTIAACNRTDPAKPAQQEMQPAQASTTTAPVATTPAQPALARLTVDDATATPALSATCNLEKIDGTVVSDADPIQVRARSFDVGGWAFDDSIMALPVDLSVRAYSTTGDGVIWGQDVEQSLERRDVQAANGGADEVLMSGFETQMDTTDLPAGRYLLRLAYLRDGQDVLCDNGRAIILN